MKQLPKSQSREIGRLVVHERGIALLGGSVFFGVFLRRSLVQVAVRKGQSPNLLRVAIGKLTRLSAVSIGDRSGLLGQS
jgi:hypothetical protein